MVDTEMTATSTQKPETIRLADALKRRTPFLDGSSTIDHAEKELRRQHAEIDRLTAENEALRAELSKARKPLADSEWLEYILHNGSKSDVHIATYEGVAITGPLGKVIRLQHDANNLRKLVEAAYGIGENIT